MKILFLGDICPTDDYRELFDDISGKALFHDLKKAIDDADFSICNFECPATNETRAIKKCGPSLKAKPQDLVMLKNAGINAVSLANNHILDYGVKGLRDTLENCENYGISYFGIENEGQKENDRLLLTKDGETVTIFSFAEEEFNYQKTTSTGAVKFDPYEDFDKIREAKKKGKVIVLYHGGIEYYRYPSPLLRKKCLKMVEAGADLVLCQHSHIIGTMEQVGDAFILYGQGNSIFGYRESSNSWNQGLIVLFDTQSGTFLDVIEAKKDGVYKAAEDSRIKVLAEMKTLSNGWTADFIELEWEKFCSEKKALYYPMLYGKGRVFNKCNRLTKNKLVDLFFNKKKKMVTMNLIRCDSHNEVVTKLLEKDYVE